MASREGATPEQGDSRARQVRTIFSEIAPRYDLLNHVLSANIDRRWRRLAVEEVVRAGPDRVLDACAGTFDLSLELTRREQFAGRVVALDFARPMLVTGREKLGEAPVDPVCADGLCTPFADRTFGAAMIAFGVRNLSDLDRGFAEFHRVLRPGGRLVILEFTTPPNRLMKHLYLFYFHRVLPTIGRWVSGHPWAYTYLPESVKAFPGPDELSRRLEAAGFENVDWRYLTGGIAAIHRADRPRRT